MYIRLSLINPQYLVNAAETLESAVLLAPNDAKLFYNLGLTYIRLGQVEKGVQVLQKTIELKPNYKDPRLAYAIILMDTDKARAKTQLEYILRFIDPEDSITKQTLEEIK